MAIMLHTKYSGKIAGVFAQNSFVDGRLSDDYDFTGAKTVKITTPITVALTDYKREGTNRYGAPVEMQDSVQELTVRQDKSFAITVDKGNNTDQGGIKAAGKMLGLQIKEQLIPYKDKYTFTELAKNAGHIVGESAALTKANICERIMAGSSALDNCDVPADGRTLFVPAHVYKYLMLSDEYLKANELAEKALAKGQVGEFDNMQVIKVPNSRWPQNLNFLIVHRSAATTPTKIENTKLHEDPPGLSGNLMEGRFYFDCFVIGARACGIYAEVDVSAGKATVLAAPTIDASAGTITSVSGADVKYTLDGSDPRYSSTAVEGKTITGAQTGDVIKAYAYKKDESAYASPVAAKTK